jgi:ATP-binding cassette, subfamily B, bacterial
MDEKEKIKKPQISGGVIYDFIKLIKPYSKSVIFLFAFIILIEGLKLVGPYILKIIIDDLHLLSLDKLNHFVNLILLFLLSLLVISLLDYLKDKKIFSVILKAEYDLPIRCQKKLLELDLSYHQEEGTGNKIAKIERGTFKLVDLLGNIFWEFLPVTLQLLSTLVILAFIDYRLFLLLIIFATIIVFINIFVNKSIYPTRKKRYKDYEKASGKMVQSIINVNTVQSFSQQKREVDEFSSLKKDIFTGEKKEWFYILKFASLREVSVSIARILFLFLGIYLVLNNQISIGTLVFVITLSEKVFSALSRVYRLYDRFAEGLEGVNRISSLLKTESSIKNTGNLKLNSINGSISFKNIDFYYNNSEKILNNLNLEIPAGAITALVGPSGGGKTTIIRLIFRHFDPSSGQVLLDDNNLKDLDLFNLRRFLSIVPQEVDIFDASIKDNISYANKNASMLEIEAAAKIANADEFIKKLKDGYDTVVGERGIKLSGGQRQRVGIARAVLANPKILIFDEATSNLDTESEKLIQDSIAKIAKNKTIIIIAHRLSTIKMADKIVVIEDGRVAEEGSHLQLVNKKDGLYKKLTSLQSLGDIRSD